MGGLLYAVLNGANRHVYGLEEIITKVDSKLSHTERV